MKRPRVVVRITTPTLVGDSPQATSRLLSQTAAAVGNLNDQAKPSTVIVTDLTVGANRIAHGLGRRARFASVAPTIADGLFGWSFTTDNDTQAIITIVGIDQPGASVEIK